MSISGYVQAGYSPHIFSPSGESDGVESRVKITYNGGKEIKVPCLVRKKCYQVAFAVSLCNNSMFDPTKVSLVFYRGSSCDNAEEEVNITQKARMISEITSTKIVGNIDFIIAQQFYTTRRKEFLYIALKIDSSLIRFLACDIAVFTNCCQITPEYNLKLGSIAQKIIKKTFWHSHAHFVSKKEKAQMPQQKTEQETEELSSFSEDDYPLEPLFGDSIVLLWPPAISCTYFGTP